MNFTTKKILTEIAQKNNLTFDQVKKIYESQFKCAEEFMKMGVHDEPDTFKNVNFIKLGKLYAKKKVIEKIIRKKQSKDDKKVD